jgi:hypothetical protein
MAKRKAPIKPKKAAGYSPAEWAPIDEAYARVKALTGSQYLAERRLMQHLRGEKLPSAVLIVGRDREGHDREQFRLLKPSHWDQPNPLTLGELSSKPGKIRVYGINPKLARYPMWFFVSRKHFDKLYPGGITRPKQPPPSSPRTSLSSPSASPSPEPAPSPAPRRNKGGAPPDLSNEQIERGIEYLRKHHELTLKEIYEPLRRHLGTDTSDGTLRRRIWDKRKG